MSGIATGTALAIGLGAAGTAASVGTSIYGANKQSNAAQSAAQLNYQAQQNALDFQKQQYATSQQNQLPWLHTGSQAELDLGNALTAQPGGLLEPWSQQFTAPTAEQAAATPGYQFALQQGLQGVERGAAARGNLLGGGEQKALEQYGQGLASTTYQQTFNNALTQYQTAYNQFQQNQANTFNRLSTAAGGGQVAANTLGQQGQAAAGNVGNILQSGAAYQGNALQNAAYQTASGYNAAASGINTGLNNALQQYQLGLGSQQGGYSYGTAPLSGFSPTQISGAFGGPSTVATIDPYGALPTEICWVAAELYGGWYEPKTITVRRWMLEHPIALFFYKRFGPRLADIIKWNKPLRRIVKAAFDRIVEA